MSKMDSFTTPYSETNIGRKFQKNMLNQTNLPNDFPNKAWFKEVNFIAPKPPNFIGKHTMFKSTKWNLTKYSFGSSSFHLLCVGIVDKERK